MGKLDDSAKKAKGRILNAFTPREASRITGLSMHMLNYLSRHGYLVPRYGGGTRGSRRHYSYRDLVIARLLQRLLSAGVEISRLKQAIAALTTQTRWLREEDLGLLKTDGVNIYRVEPDGSVADVVDGQLAFALVLDVRKVREEIVTMMDDRRREHFDLRNRELKVG